MPSAAFSGRPFVLQLFDQHADDIFQYCYRCIANRESALLLTERVFAAALERFDAKAEVVVDDLYDIADEFTERLIWQTSSGFRPSVATT